MKYDKLLDELGFSYCHVSEESLQYLLAPDANNWLAEIPKELRIIVRNILQNELIFRPRNKEDFKYIDEMMKTYNHILLCKPNKIDTFLTFLIDGNYEYDDYDEDEYFYFKSYVLDTSYRPDVDHYIDFIFKKDGKILIRFSDENCNHEKRYKLKLDDITIYFLIDNGTASIKNESAKLLRRDKLFSFRKQN